MNKQTKLQVFLQYVRHDLVNGLLVAWKKYAVIVFVFALLCADLFATLLRIRASAYARPMPDPSWGDYLFYITKGMRPFRPEDQQFDLNVLWLAFHLFLAYIVSFYPFKDLHGYGQLMLVRSGKRDYWWLSKCIWNVSSVTAFYAVIWLVTFLFALFTGSLSLVPHGEVQSTFSGTGSVDFSPAAMLLCALLMPWLASVAISLLQMTISMIAKPIFGILFVCLVLVASIFTDSFLMPGNYLMALRWSLPSIDWLHSVLVAVPVSFAAVVAGLLYFKKSDIFSS